MIINKNTKLIKINDVWFIQLFNANILVSEINCWSNNSLIERNFSLENNWWIYIFTFVNKKQILEYKILLFANQLVINLFIYLLELDGFGYKTAQAICNNNPFLFKELVLKQDINQIKKTYHLNERQLGNLLNKNTIFKNNQKANELINMLSSLGYKKELINKVLKKHSFLIDESDITLVIKKFVEIIKNEMN